MNANQCPQSEVNFTSLGLENARRLARLLSMQIANARMQLGQLRPSAERRTYVRVCDLPDKDDGD